LLLQTHRNTGQFEIDFRKVDNIIVVTNANTAVTRQLNEGVGDIAVVDLEKYANWGSDELVAALFHASTPAGVVAFTDHQTPNRPKKITKKYANTVTGQGTHLPNAVLNAVEAHEDRVARQQRATFIHPDGKVKKTSYGGITVDSSQRKVTVRNGSEIPDWIGTNGVEIVVADRSHNVEIAFTIGEVVDADWRWRQFFKKVIVPK